MELQFGYFLRHEQGMSLKLDQSSKFKMLLPAKFNEFINISCPVLKINGTVIIISNIPNCFMLVPCHGLASHVGEIVIQPSCPILGTL